jgi:virulence-associated protein VagC
MELPGETATIRKEGDRLVIELAEPVPEKSTRALVEWLKTLEPIDAEFEIPDDPPVEPEDIFGDLADDED